ncbi:MAG: DUF5666 domain-containing protein [Armatimonadetes bacterium]|nr:DUF5666 domain-containing protein [Armatimonadota bacterium]
MKIVFAVLLLAVAISVAPAASPSNNPSRTRIQNPISGVITQLDPAKGLLVLKTAAGDFTARIGAHSHFYRQKSSSDPTQFRIGDSVKLRVRRSPSAEPLVLECINSQSWGWLERIRRQPMHGVVKELTDDFLTVINSEDMKPFEYRITPRTQWNRKGAAVRDSAYKPGDSVVVVPRPLPGGGVMALAVTDNAADIALLKERSRTIVTGNVTAWDAANSFLTLKTIAGAVRRFKLNQSTSITDSSKQAAASALGVGTRVTVHFHRTGALVEQATRITIKTGVRGLKRPTVPKRHR